MIGFNYKRSSFSKVVEVLNSGKSSESSLLKVLYLDSVSVSFLEKKSIGFYLFSSIYSSAAPMALVNASVVRARGASGDG